MPWPVLGKPQGFDDWIQIIILALVAGSAVFGKVTKTLIRKFSPKKDPDAPVLGRPEPLPRRPPPPARPVARPMPQAPTATPQAAGPVAPPAQPRPASRFPRVESLPQMLRGVFKQLGDAGETPPSRSAPLPAAPPPQARAAPGIERAGRKPVAARKRARSKPGASPVAGVRPLVASVAEGDVQETQIKDSPLDTVRHPTRASLRRAIIMNEILSPPLALRRDDERE